MRADPAEVEGEYVGVRVAAVRHKAALDKLATAQVRVRRFTVSPGEGIKIAKQILPDLAVRPC